MKRSALARKTPMARAKPLSSGIRTSKAIAPSAPSLASKPKMRKCAICRAPFIKRSITHKACKPECAAALVLQVRERAERKQLAVRRLASKPRAKWLKEAETAFNSWIRWRDRDLACISCGRHHKGQYHAGHFLSVGAHPELRFSEDNVHKQCKPCNTDLGGNHHFYRIALMAKIGPARVDALEGPHAAAKYSIDDAKAVIAEYRGRLKQQQQSEKLGEQ
jgi:hypothetical protein